MELSPDWNWEPLHFHHRTVMENHRPQGPRGMSLGTTADDVTIRDRHGCEVVLSIADATLIAQCILMRYQVDPYSDVSHWTKDNRVVVVHSDPRREVVLLSTPVVEQLLSDAGFQQLAGPENSVSARDRTGC